MDSFKLDLFTPNGIVASGIACEEIFLPTSTGEIHVMPGHTHVLTQLGSGVAIVKSKSGGDRHYAVAGGLCKILDDKITILSMSGESAEHVDLARAQSAQHKAESRLDSAEHMSEIENVKWQRKLERAKARIRLGNLGQK